LSMSRLAFSVLFPFSAVYVYSSFSAPCFSAPQHQRRAFQGPGLLACYGTGGVRAKLRSLIGRVACGSASPCAYIYTRPSWRFCVENCFVVPHHGIFVPCCVSTDLEVGFISSVIEVAHTDIRFFRSALLVLCRTAAAPGDVVFCTDLDRSAHILRLVACTIITDQATGAMPPDLSSVGRRFSPSRGPTGGLPDDDRVHVAGN